MNTIIRGTLEDTPEGVGNAYSIALKRFMVLH